MSQQDVESTQTGASAVSERLKKIEPHVLGGTENERNCRRQLWDQYST
jgi:hypothetical protein